MTESSLQLPPPAGGEGTDAADRFPLSLQQDFLRMVDHGDDSGPFGPRYTIVGGWRIRGELDLAVLRAALADVVARHEALRTSLVLAGAEPYQQVRPPIPADLLVRDLPPDEPADRDRAAEEFLNEVEAGVFGIERMPLICAVVGRFDPQDAALVLMAHHTAVDGWSIQVVVRDLAACYAARRQGRRAELPAVHQYREYVAWQRASADGAAATAARAFWRANLRDAQIVPIRTDRTRADGDFLTGWHRFLLADEFRVATGRLAAETHTSPFMVLLAAYLTYLRGITGESDLVVPTFTPGRHPAWVQETVGSFYNFVPLRTSVAGCRDFRDLIGRVRATCLAAYAHEVTFADIYPEAPEVISTIVAPNAAACVFQVTQSPFIMRRQEVGDLGYTAIRRRLVSAAAGSQIPDGLLWGLELDPVDGIIGSIGYTTNLFVERTVAGMVDDFREVLRETVVPAAASIG